MLYRTHKSLSTSAKVNSLYVFDAIARAAKSQVNKKSLSADRHTGKGNAATFLSKLQAVLDGLFQDMAAISSSSTKVSNPRSTDFRQYLVVVLEICYALFIANLYRRLIMRRLHQWQLEWHETTTNFRSECHRKERSLHFSFLLLILSDEAHGLTEMFVANA